jgi:hypothetical protein
MAFMLDGSIAQFRQSVFARLSGYEDPSDADRPDDFFYRLDSHCF